MQKLYHRIFHGILLKIMKHPCIFGVLFASVTIFFCWKSCHLSVLGTAAFARKPAPIFPIKSHVLDIVNGSLETLETVLHTSDLRFVAFYAPWCAQSRKMVPKLILASEKLKDKIRFIAINCWIGTCKRNFPLHEFPKFFAYHTKYPPVEFLEPPDSWRIIRFLNSVARPFHYLGNERNFNEIIATHQAVVVAYFNLRTESSKRFSTFLKLCISSVNRVSKTLYGIVTNNKMAALAGLRKYGQIIIHQVLRNKLYFPDKFNYTADSISNWIAKSQIEIVKQLTPNMSHLDEYVNELKKGPSVLLFLSFRPSVANYSNELLHQYRIAATDYNKCTPFDGPFSRIPIKRELAEVNKKQKQPATQEIFCKYPCSLCMTVASSIYGNRCSICQRCSQNICMHRSQLDILIGSIRRLSYGLNNSSTNTCNSLKQNSYYYPDIVNICCFKELGSSSDNSFNLVDETAKLFKKNYKNKKEIIDAEIDKLTELNRIDSILEDSMKLFLETMDSFSKLDKSVLGSASKYEKLLQRKLADHSSMHEFKDDASIQAEQKTRFVQDNLKSTRDNINTKHSSPDIHGSSFDSKRLSEQLRKQRHGNFSTSDFYGLRCKTNRTVNYFYLDIDIHKTMVTNLGINRKYLQNFTSLALVDLKNEATYVVHESVQLSRNTIVEFITNFTNGRLERRLKSENSKSVCSDNNNDTCIFEVTTNSFEEVVLDDSKDVLLMYYAPWCGYCKQGYKVLLQLTLVYSGIKTLRFARIDAERNDLPYHYAVDGYPTFILFPRKRKSYSQSYPDHLPVTFKEMKHFLEKHCSNRTKRSMKSIKS